MDCANLIPNERMCTFSLDRMNVRLDHNSSCSLAASSTNTNEDSIKYIDLNLTMKKNPNPMTTKQ